MRSVLCYVYCGVSIPLCFCVYVPGVACVPPLVCDRLTMCVCRILSYICLPVRRVVPQRLPLLVFAYVLLLCVHVGASVYFHSLQCVMCEVYCEACSM